MNFKNYDEKIYRRMDWMGRATQFYSQYDFVKYVYIVRNDEQIVFKNTL